MAERITRDKAKGTQALYNTAINKYCDSLNYEDLLPRTPAAAATAMSRFMKLCPTKAQIAALRAVLGVTHEAMSGFMIQKSSLMKAVAGTARSEAKYATTFPIENVIKTARKQSLNEINRRSTTILLLTYAFTLRAIDMENLGVKLPMTAGIVEIRYSPKHAQGSGGEVTWWTNAWNDKCDKAKMGVARTVKANFNACKSKMIITVRGAKYWIVAATTEGTDPQRALKRNTIASIITKGLQEADIDISCYKPHSIKAAAVSLKYRAGWSMDTIALQGKHGSTAILKRHYLKPTDTRYKHLESFCVKEPPVGPEQEANDSDEST